MKKIILLLLALILAACSSVPKSEYDTNLDKWQNSGVTHYRFSLFVGCFCAFRDDMPLSIEVQNGEVVSMTYADGTPIPADDPQLEFLSRYATIDRLFSELKADLDGAADEVTVTYHATYGFPEQISIDRIKDAIDDELGLTVADFEVVK
jgi:hypothetical protein